MHFPHPGGPGIGLGGGAFTGIFTDVLAGLVFIICFTVVVGLLVILVRFLLIATRAAELYIANNSTATKASDAPTSAQSTTSTQATKPTPKSSTK